MVKEAKVKSVCAEALGVSRKNIYRSNKQSIKDQELADRINEAHIHHPAFGQYRMALELKVNHKRTERVMKKFGIKAPRRKNHHFCTQSTYAHNYTNLIREIVPEKFVPHLIWTADVSYFKFQGEFWYLAVIEDVATRQILSARVGKHHDAELILSALKQAILVTGHTPAYFHSDQGTEFMAEAVTKFLEDKGVKISVSAKASPWQNGWNESFFGRFKDEFGDINRFETVGELIEEIYSQIRYYNEGRIHRSLKMPPAKFAALKFPEYCLQKRGA